MNMNMPYGFPSMPMVQPPFAFYNKVPMAPPLYVGDLDENIHENTLFDFFSKFGPLHFVRIMKDSNTGKSRGFAYVNFISPKDAENAVQFAQYEKIGRKHIRIMFKRNVKDLPTDANLFVKNLDPNVTVKDLHKHFAQPGVNVLCAKVSTNSEGVSLRYGYVQFEKKEDADAALNAFQNSKLGETEIQLSHFISKDKRPGTAVKRNIYVKNLPVGKSQQEVEQVVNEVFSSFGKIETFVVIKHGENRHFAFVCYQDEESAQNAFNSLSSNSVTLDGAEEPLYVSWHQGKAERSRELKRQFQEVQNNTNLYVKNLRLDVTESDLKRAFQQFGQIVSVACKDWISEDGQKKARFGFIAYQDATDTNRAYVEGPNVQEIRDLYLPESKPYINLHQNKDNRKKYIISQRQWRQQMQSMPGMGNLGGMGGMGNPALMNMAQMASMPNRKFPPMMSAPMMNRHFQQGPKPPQRVYKQGWNKGPNQRNSMPPGPRREGVPINRPPQQAAVRQPLQNNKKPEPINKPNPQPQTQPQPQAAMTVQNLRSKLGEFLQLETERQRQILGELLFPLIKAISGDNLAPKITGMLIDLTVLEVTEILEFLENPALLSERVNEAIELIETEGI